MRSFENSTNDTVKYSAFSRFGRVYNVLYVRIQMHFTRMHPIEIDENPFLLFKWIIMLSTFGWIKLKFPEFLYLN